MVRSTLQKPHALFSEAGLKIVYWAVVAIAVIAEILLSWIILRSRYRGFGTLMPIDLLSFRQNAAMITHQAGPVFANAAALPYPPPFLLMSIPLTWVSQLAGTIAWVVVGNVLLVIGARAIRLPWRVIALGVLSPPNIYAVTMGQTGTFVGGWLLISLGLAETQPILAGVAAGCLVIKPQFAVLLPICYFSSRNWRAICAATITTITLCLIPGVLFGRRIWQKVFLHQIPGVGHMLGDTWPHGYQYLMATIYMTLRSLGVGYHAAAMVQILASITSVIIAWWLWRPRSHVNNMSRLAATLCLVVIVTPYGSVYDLPALAMVVANGAPGAELPWPKLFAFFWITTGLYVFFSTYMFLVGGVLLVITLLSILVHEARTSPRP